ncbi:hypothetical protein AUC45_07580 [Erythrobacter sp. YT30]|nr:hypothetical protein AUC45_07580 [Erythrobacter sp. YT30]
MARVSLAASSLDQVVERFCRGDLVLSSLDRAQRQSQLGTVKLDTFLVSSNNRRDIGFAWQYKQPPAKGRMISLHAVDRLLYDFKLNWISDLGLSLAVLCCAVLYVRKRQLIGPRN